MNHLLPLYVKYQTMNILCCTIFTCVSGRGNIFGSIGMCVSVRLQAEPLDLQTKDSDRFKGQGHRSKVIKVKKVKKFQISAQYQEGGPRSRSQRSRSQVNVKMQHFYFQHTFQGSSSKVVVVKITVSRSKFLRQFSTQSTHGTRPLHISPTKYSSNTTHDRKCIQQTSVKCAVIPYKDNVTAVSTTLFQNSKIC